MVKIKNPFVSWRASGKLGNITLLRRRQTNVAEKTPVVPDQKTPAQLAWRTMYQKCADLWHLLSAAEKAEWERQGTARHMTGYAWYMSQCLRPNPGIYLPLAGGSMTGAIDMAGNKIEDLPDPAADQEPVTRKYFDDNIPVGGYTEGARVQGAAQNIPHNTTTVHAFNSEHYDTDNIHDNSVNNSRLTCRTAGKYLIIGQIAWGVNIVGQRLLAIRFNGSDRIGAVRADAISAIYGQNEVSTIYSLAVNEYVELRVWQNSGDTVTSTVITPLCPTFMMQRIG